MSEQEMDHEKCNALVWKHGRSAGLFDGTAAEADARCKAMTEASGSLHDWHSIAGRINILAIPDSTQELIAERDSLRVELERCRGEHRAALVAKDDMSKSATKWRELMDRALSDLAAVRERLGECERERDEAARQRDAAVTTANEIHSRLTEEAYDAIYSGEPDAEREVRWKWVTIGILDLRTQRDEALAKLAAAEKRMGEG